MGRGAHDIMLDDLYANMEEAASPIIREKVRKWYSGTIYNPRTITEAAGAAGKFGLTDRQRRM